MRILTVSERPEMTHLAFFGATLLVLVPWVNILPRNPYNAISTFFENLKFLTIPFLDPEDL